MSEFLMPSLGADMDDGTLLEWYVKPGDTVNRGDVVALVDTDKAAIEIEIFEDGVVAELVINEGKKVAVGTPLARIQALGEAVNGAVAAAEVAEDATPLSVEEEPIKEAPTIASKAPQATPAARKHALERGIDLASLTGTGKHGVITKVDVDHAASEQATPEAVVQLAKETLKSERIRVSPLARRLAKEQGVELSAILGTGKNKAIVKADVLQTASSTPASEAVAPPSAQKPAAKKEEKADRSAAMRRAIAAALGKSKREIPHYYLSQAIDMSKALSWLEEENLKRSITERVVPATLLLKATALAAKEVASVNGFWTDEGFKPSDAVHLGVGISLRQGGLIAPCIHNADQKDLSRVMTDLRDLVKRARKLQLKSSEMTDATITVTNLGDQGVASVYGIIYPPQVALVGFGKVTEQAWAENGMLAVRPIVQTTLAADHRASDGHVGGLFLMAINNFLQTPEAL